MTADTADTVEAIRQLRAMGALQVNYKGCQVTFEAVPMRPVTAENATLEYERIALASAT